MAKQKRSKEGQYWIVSKNCSGDESLRIVTEKQIENAIASDEYSAIVISGSEIARTRRENATKTARIRKIFEG